MEMEMVIKWLSKVVSSPVLCCVWKKEEGKLCVYLPWFVSKVWMRLWFRSEVSRVDESVTVTLQSALISWGLIRFDSIIIIIIVINERKHKMELTRRRRCDQQRPHTHTTQQHRNNLNLSVSTTIHSYRQTSERIVLSSALAAASQHGICSFLSSIERRVASSSVSDLKDDPRLGLLS